jgi:hypothetical protein
VRIKVRSKADNRKIARSKTAKDPNRVKSSINPFNPTKAQCAEYPFLPEVTKPAKAIPIPHTVTVYSDGTRHEEYGMTGLHTHRDYRASKVIKRLPMGPWTGTKGALIPFGK